MDEKMELNLDLSTKKRRFDQMSVSTSAFVESSGSPDKLANKRKSPKFGSPDKFENNRKARPLLPKLIVPSILKEEFFRSLSLETAHPCPTETCLAKGLKTAQPLITDCLPKDMETAQPYPMETCLAKGLKNAHPWPADACLANSASFEDLETAHPWQTNFPTEDLETAHPWQTNFLTEDLATARACPTDASSCKITSFEGLNTSQSCREVNCLAELEKYVGPDCMSMILDNTDNTDNNNSAVWSFEDILEFLETKSVPSPCPWQCSPSFQFVQTQSPNQNIVQDHFSDAGYVSTTYFTDCESSEFDENDAALLCDSDDGCDDESPIDCDIALLTPFQSDEDLNDPFGLGVLPNPATILGFDPGMSTFEFDNDDVNNTTFTNFNTNIDGDDIDELAWFPITDLDLFEL